MDVEEAVAELYQLHPDRFIARRKELADSARNDGTADAAREIGALRRPTRSAWVVNAFVRADAEALAPLLAMGAELRDAQRRLDGARMRDLTGQRRKVIDSAVRAAVRLSGPQSEGVRTEVAATFEAALSDPASAEAVAAATLVRPLEWSGFGDTGPALAVVPGSGAAAGSARKKPADKPDDTAEAEAQRRRREMATAELTSAAQTLAQAEETVATATERIARLERELGQARDELKTATAERRKAAAHQQGAERRVRRLGG